MKKTVIYIIFTLSGIMGIFSQPEITSNLGTITDNYTFKIERTEANAATTYCIGFTINASFTVTAKETLPNPNFALQGYFLGTSTALTAGLKINTTFTLAAGQYRFLFVNPNPSLKAFKFEMTFTCPTCGGGTAGGTTPSTAPPLNILPNGGNYVKTAVPRIEKTAATFNPDNSEIVSIQYFDGLGRPVEKVQNKFTPSQKDLVTLLDYDEYGRESFNWLPTPTANVAGAFVSSVASTAQAAYGGDAKPYAYPVYEASPLNRVLKQFGPGADWQNNGKAVETAYRTNTGTEVKYYIAGGTNQAPTLSQTTYYAAGQLFVTETKDEDGNLSCEFRDKLGQVVLTRQMLNGVGLDTYYVYNDFGNRCFVLPPRIQDEGATQDKLNLLAYQYKYDNRNRCTWKKFPGCEAVFCVYDNADRLIYTQDGEQRKKSEWTFSIPDALGRATLTGTCKDTISVSGKVVKGVFSTAGSYKAYYIYVDGAAKTFLNAPTILSVNYYDGYEFLGYNGIPNDANTQYVAEAGYGACYGDHQAANKPKCKGLLTGTMTAQMNPDGTVSATYLYSVMYYDYRNRLVQTKSANPLAGGIEKEYIAYDFIGNPTGKKHIHQATGKTTQTEVYVNTYDHAERLTKTTHQLNGGTITAIADNTYDELGRLKTNMKGGQANLIATYAYNVRSWTSGITSYHFNEALTYSYGGNVATMQWGQAGKTRKYTFTYDNLSRLTNAAYTGEAPTNLAASYSYDKHGNIKTLVRYGLIDATNYGVIDNIQTAEYNGNQLKYITDSGPNVALAASPDFKDYTKSTGVEYTYNANGAVTQDLNKGISAITYNVLNLPQMIDIKNPSVEGRNEYTYSASGVKLKAVQKWNPSYSTAPVIGSTINTAALTQSATTDYIGNIIYENGALKRILIDGGYVEGGAYYYYIRDHLGNNRIVANASTAVVQTTQYYPFGAAFADAAAPSIQPYKYNNKEFDMRNTLNMYDNFARLYDPGFPHFLTPDQLAEKRTWESLYCAMANNPLRFVDPDGRTPKDKIMGFVIGVTTNIIPFSTSLRETYSPTDASDYNTALQATDAAAMVIGAGIVDAGLDAMAAGGSTAAVGASITVTGVGAPEGAAVALIGGTVSAAGVGTAAAGSLMMFNAANNASKGYNYGDTKSQAQTKAKDHAKTPRESKGGENIGMDELNESSRGKNYSKMKEKGATSLGRRNPKGKNYYMDHPDGHDSSAGEASHHDTGHFHSTNPQGEEKIFPYEQ